ncbi:Hypothetical predicted protein, partial [Pelobates cultripes]
MAITAKTVFPLEKSDRQKPSLLQKCDVASEPVSSSTATDPSCSYVNKEDITSAVVAFQYQLGHEDTLTKPKTEDMSP